MCHLSALFGVVVFFFVFGGRRGIAVVAEDRGMGMEEHRKTDGGNGTGNQNKQIKSLRICDM